MSLVSISEISSHYLASAAMQAGVSLTWPKTPKTGFLVMWLIKEPSHEKRDLSVMLYVVLQTPCTATQ